MQGKDMINEMLDSLPKGFITKACERQGLDKSFIATGLGLTPAYVAQIDSLSSRPSISTVLDIALLLGVSVRELAQMNCFEHADASLMGGCAKVKFNCGAPTAYIPVSVEAAGQLIRDLRGNGEAVVLGGDGQFTFINGRFVNSVRIMYEANLGCTSEGTVAKDAGIPVPPAAIDAARVMAASCPGMLEDGKGELIWKDHDQIEGARDVCSRMVYGQLQKVMDDMSCVSLREFTEYFETAGIIYGDNGGTEEYIRIKNAGKGLAKEIGGFLLNGFIGTIPASILLPGTGSSGLNVEAVFLDSVAMMTIPAEIGEQCARTVMGR